MVRTRREAIDMGDATVNGDDQSFGSALRKHFFAFQPATSWAAGSVALTGPALFGRILPVPRISFYASSFAERLARSTSIQERKDFARVQCLEAAADVEALRTSVVAICSRPGFATSSDLIFAMTCDSGVGYGPNPAYLRQLTLDLHERYLVRWGQYDTDTLEHFMTEQIRMGGVYWGVSALELIGKFSDSHPSDESDSVLSPATELGCLATSLPSPDPAGSAVCSSVRLRKADVVRWVKRCQHPSGGFGPAEGHDPHITSSHYAVLILSICDKLSCVDTNKLARWVASLQREEDGAFQGDPWGEVDSRFTYCGLSCLTILDRLDLVDCSMARDFLHRCLNYDNGFGWVPGGESHAASTFCCIGGLALVEGLHLVDRDSVALWLSERQTESGGFNGRPEKAPDVCYSWWIVAVLAILQRLDWIDISLLRDFVIASQDDEGGGIADRPGDMADVFHTFFGLASLALLRTDKRLCEIHPVYALPRHVVNHLELPSIVG